MANKNNAMYLHKCIENWLAVGGVALVVCVPKFEKRKKITPNTPTHTNEKKNK